jgi:hypothetical protein
MSRHQMEDLQLKFMRLQLKMAFKPLKLLSQPQVDILLTLTNLNKKRLSTEELLPSLQRLIPQVKLFKLLNQQLKTHSVDGQLSFLRLLQMVELQPSLKALPLLQMVALLPMSLELMLMEDQLHTQSCQQLLHHMFHHQALTLPQEEEKLFTHTPQLHMDMTLLLTLLNQLRMDMKLMLISLQLEDQLNHTNQTVLNKPYLTVQFSKLSMKPLHLEEKRLSPTLNTQLQMVKELPLKALLHLKVVLIQLLMKLKLPQVEQVLLKFKKLPAMEEL